MNCVLLTFALFVGVAFSEGELRPASNFDAEIMPLLTKAGCNAGACHGAAAGRGGFHLSLLGSDPAADYKAIVQAMEGRRINLAKPELSLVFAKPTGRLPHGGDVPLPAGETGAQRLLNWIKAGAPRGAARRLTSFQASPVRFNCDKIPSAIQLTATACFDDGPAEDVTAWTTFSTADKQAVEIDHDQSIAHILRRGQHVLIARFLDKVVALQVNVPMSDMQIDLAKAPRNNFIDDEVLKTLSILRLPTSPAADDATFLRRVRLDLTGRLPTGKELEQFLKNEDSQKRAQLVDRLLATEDFADYWTLRFARHLRIHGLPNESAGVTAYKNWLQRGIHQGTPLDDMARELITTTGDSHTLGPANFGRMVSDARGHAELVGQFFLGVRLGCANCHNHPLDKWTQDDYHGLAAVFARLSRGRTVEMTPRGSVTNLRTGEAATPRIPGEYDLDPSANNLAPIAQWLTGSEERTFARATVNRIWQAMFGRGLVEPIDDMRDTNPATHPELLDRLAQDFIDHRCSLRHTLRTIALSQTYGRSEGSLPENALDDRFYSHAINRPLMPEVLADAIADATGVPEEFDDQPYGMRAVALIDPQAPAPSLDVLGRCRPMGACAEISESAVGMATQLHLLNGQLINRKLLAAEGRCQRMLAEQKSSGEIVTEFYIRALSRRPTEAELSSWSQRLDSGPQSQRGERVEDFVWSLLNSRQFRTNH